MAGNLIRARSGDRGLGSGPTGDRHSGDSERESVQVVETIDNPPTSPEPSARFPRLIRVTDQLGRSSSDCEKPTQNGSRPKPKSKSQGNSAPMWSYDRIAGCRINKGRRFLEVVWPNTFVPVEEVEGGEEWWRKYRKVPSLEKRKQRRKGHGEGWLGHPKRALQKKGRRM